MVTYTWLTYMYPTVTSTLLLHMNKLSHVQNCHMQSCKKEQRGDTSFFMEIGSKFLNIMKLWSHAPNCHMFTTTTYTQLSHVHNYHMTIFLYTTYKCLQLSHIHNCHLYTTIKCTQLSHVYKYYMDTNVTYTNRHLYTTVTCTCNKTVMCTQLSPVNGTWKKMWPYNQLLCKFCRILGKIQVKFTLFW